MENRAVFLAGLEHDLSKQDVAVWREKFGSELKALGFVVKEPTLGKNIDLIPKEQLLKEDQLLQNQSHVTVGYIPDFSEGVLHEFMHAKAIGQLVFAFTDKGNSLPKQFASCVDAWFSDFEKLKEVLSIYLSPIGEYFTSAHTNNIQGDVVIYGLDIHQVAPHHLCNLIENSKNRRNIFYFCCEKSHVHELAQKLPTILRLGKVENIYILTKDGSPHDVQIHTIAEEVVENVGFQGNVFHYVVEKGNIFSVSRKSIKLSRHLSHIENLIQKPIEHNTKKVPFVGILTGALSDEEKIRQSTIFEILKTFDIDYDYKVISSDRNPEELRRYCLQNKEKLDAVIAIAGGVPNLPIVVKGWLPDTPVICVPLDENSEYALASITTPKDRPIIVSGYGNQGLKKAAYILKDIFFQKIKRKKTGK